jgi:large subunit ribosomal protein L1
VGGLTICKHHEKEEKEMAKVTKDATESKETQATTDETAVDEQNAELQTTDSPAATAKAGRRSTKGIKETEEKIAKEDRKEHAAEIKASEAEEPSHRQKPARTKLERAGKKLREVAKLVEAKKDYTAKEAIELAIKTTTTKFDSTVELHAKLALDPRQADQNIRDQFVLPEGSGRAVRVAVFCDSDQIAEAKKAGADVAGSDDFLAQLDKGTIDFDILISTPAVMAKLGKYARVLGPKGLMPSPKNGTVTANVTKAVADAKAGRVEYRVDSTGNVHVPVGKISFGADRIAKNLTAVMASIKSAKPSTVKSAYVKSMYLTTTMGPSIKIANNEL